MHFRARIRGEMDGARTRQCNPINQETPILGAAASAAGSTRSCCTCVESVERGGPPCEKGIPASSPLQCVHTLVMRELQANTSCTLFCSRKTRPRHRIPPTRHSASAQQRFHAVCLVLPRSDHRWRRPRGPPQRQRSAAERTLEAFSSAAAGGEANSLAGQTLGFGVKDTLTSRAAIHFSNALFVR